MAEPIIDPFDPIATAEHLASRVWELEQQNYELQQALARANQQVAAMGRCRTFEILTRAGLELEWDRVKVGYPCFDVLYFDIDNLKQLNTTHSITGANRMIREAFACIRQTEIVGRWFSGDEFVVICVGSQSRRILARLEASFATQGISFTSAIGQCLSADLQASVAPLMREVERAKAGRVLAS